MKKMTLLAVATAVGMSSAALAEPVQLSTVQMDGVTAAGTTASVSANTLVVMKEWDKNAVVKKKISKKVKAIKGDERKLRHAFARLHAKLRWLAAVRMVKILGLH